MCADHSRREQQHLSTGAGVTELTSRCQLYVHFSVKWHHMVAAAAYGPQPVAVPPVHAAQQPHAQVSSRAPGTCSAHPPSRMGALLGAKPPALMSTAILRPHSAPAKQQQWPGCLALMPLQAPPVG
jgi:hypothetical protein